MPAQQLLPERDKVSPNHYEASSPGRFATVYFIEIFWLDEIALLEVAQNLEFVFMVNLLVFKKIGKH